MSRIEARLSKLEAMEPVGMSLELRAWLGHRLTDAEQAELAAMPVREYVPPTEADMASWSPEMRRWWDQR